MIDREDVYLCYVLFVCYGDNVTSCIGSVIHFLSVTHLPR